MALERIEFPACVQGIATYVLVQLGDDEPDVKIWDSIAGHYVRSLSLVDDDHQALIARARELSALPRNQRPIIWAGDCVSNRPIPAVGSDEP